MKSIKTPLLNHLMQVLNEVPLAAAGGFLVAFSGGPDSTALLHGLTQLRHVHGKTIRAAHIHHATGGFADTSRSSVRRICTLWSVPLIEAEYRHLHGNFEYQAAEFRRRFLEQSLLPDEWVLLGHHAGDQAETLLMALSRGAGSASPVVMAPFANRRARPFLNLDPCNITAHLSAFNLDYVDDPSNRDQTRFRNAVRHQVLPVLDAFHQGTALRLARWGQQWQKTRSQMSEFARVLVTDSLEGDLLPRSLFKQQPVFLWDFLLQAYWRRFPGFRPNQRQAESIRSWLENDRWGRFDTQSGELHVDLDGIIATHRKPLETRSFVWNEWLDWSGLSLRFAPNATLTTQKGIENGLGGEVRPASSCPKRWRERMRVRRTPFRVRRGLPEVVVGRNAYHILQLFAERNEICSVEVKGCDEQAEWLRRLAQTGDCA